MLSSTIANRRWRAVLAVAFALWLYAPGAAATDIFWHNNYGPALSEAKSTGKPILMAFRCVP